MLEYDVCAERQVSGLGAGRSRMMMLWSFDGRGLGGFIWYISRAEVGRYLGSILKGIE